MAKRSSAKLVELRLGPLPVEAINRALSLELGEGEVVFTIGAQIHAQRNHPTDFPDCLPHSGAVVANPLYVGDDFRNPGCIELISRISALRTGLLVAISVEQDESGAYQVRSIYPVSEGRIASRLARGFLRRA